MGVLTIILAYVWFISNKAISFHKMALEMRDRISAVGPSSNKVINRFLSLRAFAEIVT